MAMPVFSMIVPMYNVEDYLPQCLDSLRDQTLQDIEIICVDDGSPDDSRQIAELYARADDRIRVIGKPNGGLSSARNAGIRAARGEHLCFIDSDDLVLPETCQILLDAFQETGADVVTFGAQCYPDFCFDGWIAEMATTRDVVYDEFSSDILFKEHSHPFACRTAVKRTLMEENGILFDEEVPFGEDQVFHFALYPRAHKVAFIKDKLYLYRIKREGSLTATRNEDYLSKAREHCKLVNVIAEDWRALGLLDGSGANLLDWSVGFLVPLLDELDAAQRAEAFETIKGSWTAWFGDEAAVLGALTEPSRSLAKVVYDGISDDARFLEAVKRFYVKGASDPRASLKQRAKNAVKRFLPASTIKALRARRPSGDHSQWYEEDAARRQRSLERVREEAAQKGMD